MKLKEMVFALLFLFGPMAMALNDSEIAEILRTANQAELDVAKMATTRASSPDVKDFAKDMIADHQANQNDEAKITKAGKIFPQPNDTATELKKGVQDQMMQLGKQSGFAFDKAYIDNQVAMHRQLLSDLNQKLIPAASNPEFKAFLNSTKDHVEKHLSKAQEIQTALKK
ncbi:MAG: DUF4142 domain-containing protein [Bdellovibrio sp.]